MKKRKAEPILYVIVAVVVILFCLFNTYPFLKGFFTVLQTGRDTENGKR